MDGLGGLGLAAKIELVCGRRVWVTATVVTVLLIRSRMIMSLSRIVALGQVVLTRRITANTAVWLGQCTAQVLAAARVQGAGSPRGVTLAGG